MKKSNNHITTELMSSGASQDESKHLADIAHRFGQTPRLSRSQKNQMLRDIIQPKQRSLHKFGLIVGTLAAVVSAFVVPSAVYSQPGDGVLYEIKRGAETVRSIVQPGFEPSQPLPQIDDDTRKSDDSDNSGHGSDNKDKSDDSKREDAHVDGSDDKSKSGSNGSSNSPDAGSQNDTETIDHNSARDACRDALDQRKDNGEDIDSDQYKLCDSQ